MNISKKLIGLSALVGMVILSVSQLSAQRNVDEGKNFTVSDSPQTTVFNLQSPSGNRHIHDLRAKRAAAMGQPAPAPAAATDPCEPTMVVDYVDQYLVRLDKAAPSAVALNEPFDYEYLVTAKDKVSRVVVTEQIPDGAEFVSADPEAEVSGSKVTWTLFDLARGQEVALTLTVKPTGVADLSSCATIKAYPVACTVVSVGVPELTIVKTTPNERVLLGSDVPWNITITNTGNFCAYDVVVTDTLPAGVSHASGGKTLTSNIGTLAPGESRSITVDTIASAPGEHCNVAKVDSSNAGSAEDDACIVVVESGLEVSKTGTEMEFVGKEASYTITVTNTGDVPLSDVVVTDTVPAQNRLLTAPGARIDGNTATWTTSLSAGQSKEFKLTVLGLEAGTYCNQVSAASAAYGLSDSDQACTEWRGYPALLFEVIDTNDPLLLGQETTYVIQVTNQGTASDTNVKVDALLPPELEVVSAAGATQGTISGRNVTFAPVPELRAKQTVEYRIVARAVAKGDARFQANLSSDLLQTPVPEVEPTQVY